MRPCNNTEDVDFVILFFFLNLIVKLCSIRIVINIKYGHKQLGNSYQIFDPIVRFVRFVRFVRKADFRTTQFANYFRPY